MAIIDDRYRERMLTLLDGLAGKTKYYVAQMRGPQWVREAGPLTIVNAQSASDTFNCVTCRELAEADGVAAIAEICSGFNAAGLPAAWWTGDGLRADFVARELARHHFVEDETDVAMLAELGAVPPQAAVDGFEVRLVRSAAEVLAFGRLLADLADPPDPSTLAYYQAVSALGDAGDGPMRLFLGCADGRPVSTASLYLDGDTGHIFDVSTPASSRGRGYGMAMVSTVLRHARDAGARRAGTEASDDGVGLYRRLGFEDVGLMRVYSNKRHIAETSMP